MSMCVDPIADMISRVRNAIMRKKESVSLPFSKLKESVLRVLESAGYVEKVQVFSKEEKKGLTVYFSYKEGAPIGTIRRVSKPSLRIYRKKAQLTPFCNGYGLRVISTSQGVLSDKEARMRKVGGEVLVEVFSGKGV